MWETGDAYAHALALMIMKAHVGTKAATVRATVF